MVRATDSEIVKLSGGAYIGGMDGTAYDNFAAQVDAELDTMALPATLSTTGTKEVALANREAYRFVLHAEWSAGGGAGRGIPEPMSLYNRTHYNLVHQQVKKLVAASTYGGITTIDLIDESE